MLNKKLKTLSNFLRKEKVSVTIGVVLGVLITLGSQTDNTLSNNDTVTVQADAIVEETENVYISIEPVERLISKSENVFSAILDEALSEDTVVEETTEIVVEEAVVENTTEIVVEETVVEETTEVVVTKGSITEVFEITGYCPCRKCCGNFSSEVTGKSPSTSTGVVPVQGRTIAVDPRVIPYGTKVYIDGHEYVAEDCGGAIKGNRIDMYFNSHQEALVWGRKHIEVTYSK